MKWHFIVGPLLCGVGFAILDVGTSWNRAGIGALLCVLGGAVAGLTSHE